MLRVYLKNAADTERCMLVFPPQGGARSQDLGEHEGSALEIRAVESTLEGLNRHMPGMTLRPRQGMQELEFLDRHTEGMTEKEKTVFQAALEIEKPRNVIELVNLSCNLDKFVLYEEADDIEGLGEYVLENSKITGDPAQDMDYKAVGEQYAKEHAGCFTGRGYVVRTGEAIEPVYNGKLLPDPGYDKSCVMQAWLYTPYYAAGHYSAYHLSLPTSEERLSLAAKNLGVEKLDERVERYIRCRVPELVTCLPYTGDIGELNAFAGLLLEKGILVDAESKKTLLAALEAEMPEDMSQAMEVASELEYYKILPEDVKTAVDYAHYFLEDAQIYVDDEIKPFLDYERFGKYQMNRDGVTRTKYGLIIRENQRISQLTEALTELKLFSPLKADLYPYDDDGGRTSDQMEELDSRELCRYESEILEQIGQQCIEEEEGERGLAIYIENLLLRRKVFSMNPTVETWNGELWGVLEVKSYGDLSPQELSGLMREWEGQESDGWGEGFEQREIKTDEGNLFVSFWNSGSDFFIKTEQELKQELGMGMQMGGDG